MRSEGYSVCRSLGLLPRFRVKKKRHQRVQRYTGFIYEFRKSAAFRSYVVKVNKPDCKSAQAYLRVYLGGTRSHNECRVYIDSRMLYTTVTSPCHTLRELL